MTTLEFVAAFKAELAEKNKALPADKQLAFSVGTLTAAAVKHRINGDRKHGWGADDGMFVLGAIWAFENGDEIPEPAKIRLRRYVVNCSATRLYLESKKVNLLDKPEKGEKGSKATSDELADELAG